MFSTKENTHKDGAWPSPRASNAADDDNGPATQWHGDEDGYSAHENGDIGHPVGGNRRELFVSEAPLSALRQQFDRLQPEFVALHDLGTTSSRKLLAGVAEALGQAVQTLVIRRQGMGTELATLEYIDVIFTGGTPLRVYSTDMDADRVTRQDMSQLLVARSRLCAVLVGDLPPHLMSTALQPIKSAMNASAPRNRLLLLLPLTSHGGALANHGTDFSRDTGIDVRTTPQVNRLSDAWSFINSTWNRLQSSQAQLQPQSPPAQPTQAQPSAYAMRPMPAVGGSQEDGKDSQPLTRYVNQLSGLSGMVSCCVFDMASGASLTHAGTQPLAAVLSAQGNAMLAAIVAACKSMKLGHSVAEATITLDAQYLLVLRAVPKHPGLALHAVMDKAHTNASLARLQIMRADSLL